MSEGHEREATRRQFFHSLLRYVALGALTGGSALLLSKRREGVTDDRCINHHDCRDCSRCYSCPVSEYSPPKCEPERATLR